MATVVPRERTPATAEEIVPVLAASLEARGTPPTQELLGGLMSQIWIETGRGDSLFNNGVGNVSASKSYPGLIIRPPWYDAESIAARQDGPTKTRYLKLHQDMLNGKAPRAFRAYETLREGMDDYVDKLHTRFPTVLAAAKTGDARALAQAIYDSYYCHSPQCHPDNSTPGLASLGREFERGGLLDSFPKALPSTKDPETNGSSPSSEPSDPVEPAPSSSSSFLPPPQRQLDVVEGSPFLMMLRAGAEGSLVTLWQSIVNRDERIDPKLDLDEKFGGLTEAATMAWQDNRELLPDAWVGPKTWSKAVFG